MSEVIKWSELSAEEHDRLIHTKVMDKDPDVLCSGLAEMSDLGDWYCFTCGQNFLQEELMTTAELYSPGKQHKQVTPSYSIDMNALMQIVTSHKFMKVEIEYAEGWTSENVRWQLFECRVHPYDNKIISVTLPSIHDAVMIAALKACGVEVIT